MEVTEFPPSFVIPDELVNRQFDEFEKDECPLVTLSHPSPVSLVVSSVMSYPVEMAAYSKGFPRIHWNNDDEEKPHLVHDEIGPERRIDPNDIRSAGVVVGLATQLAARAGTPFTNTDFLTEELVESAASPYMTECIEFAYKKVVARDGYKAIVLQGPCGCAKTTTAINVIKEVFRLGPVKKAPVYVLAITAQVLLCEDTVRRIEEETNKKMHLYINGPVPSDSQLAVSSLDSLHKTITDNESEYSRVADVVWISELQTVIEHLFMSATMSDPCDKRQRAIHLLLTAMARARIVITDDKDVTFAGKMLLATALVRRRTLGFDSPIHVAHYTLSDQVQRSFVKLTDEGALFNLARQTLSEDKRIAIAEPSNQACQALASKLREEFPSKTIEELHGKLPTSRKRKILASDTGPGEYLLTNDVSGLIYTSTFGTGVDVSGEVFHRVVSVDRRFHTYRQTTQMEARIRTPIDSADGVRTIYLLEDPRNRKELWRLSTVDTIEDAIAKFEQKMRRESHFASRYNFLAKLDPLVGRLNVDHNDPIVVLTATVCAAYELEINLKQLVADLTRYDTGSAIVDADIESNRDDRTNLKKARKEAKETNASALLPVDGEPERERATKMRDLVAIGQDPAGPYASSIRFMTRLAGPSSVGSLNRLAVFVTLVFDGRTAALEIEQRRLDVATERAPLRTLDDRTGIGMTREADMMAWLLRGFGHNDLRAYLTADPPPTIFDPDVVVLDSVTNETHKIGDQVVAYARELKKRMRYDNIKIRCGPGSIAKYLLRAFFGFDGVQGPRRRELDLSLEILPRFCAHTGVALSQQCLAVCEKAAGTWASEV